MNKLKVWKGTCDESTVYLDLDAGGDGKFVALLARNAQGGRLSDLLYIRKDGIRRAMNIREKLGFKMTHGGRIALRDDPVTEELLKLKKGNCPHCGHGGCD